MAKEDEDTGVLELTVRKEGVESKGNGPVIEVASLHEHGWESLIIEDLSSLTFVISPDILQQKSSFFRSLLGGDFRESLENHVSVTWDPTIFCSLLHHMCSGKLHLPCNMENFLEGILFFGVETAMAALTETINRGSSLKWAPKLWSLAKGMGQWSVAEACVEAFAINFEDGINQGDLHSLPFGFLASCIDHKQLTVTSEKFLCESLVKWFFCKQEFQGGTTDRLPNSDESLLALNYTECNDDGRVQYCEEHFISSDRTFYGIFQKVKVLLLPLDFILGRLSRSCPANVFCVNATAYEELFHFLEEVGGKTIQQLQARKSDDLTLRITKHSIKMDFAGCHQITAAVLFHALLRLVRQSSINDLETYLKVETEIHKLLSEGFTSLKSFDRAWCKEISLKKLCHVNLERCWRVDQSSLASWLCVACPNLKVLNVSHCPQLDVSILQQISLSCKILETVNMSLYFKRPPAEPNTQQDGLQIVNHSPFRHSENNPRTRSLMSLTNLSLQGRCSLRDHHLALLARFCPNLSIVSLGGCFQLTDVGLAQFLASFKRLTVLEAAYTSLGGLSVNALLSQLVPTSCPPLDNFYSLHPPGMMHNAFIVAECLLTALDLEGCLGVDNVSVSKLLNKASFLRNLNLGFTSVDDSTMFSFHGTSLDKLNLRETQVSGFGVAHIMKWNPNLKVLNIRGCRRAVMPLAFGSPEASHSEHTSRENMPKELALDDLAVGWGFSDSTLKAWKYFLHSLQSFSIGLGGRISEGTLSALSEVSPWLKHLSLSLQVVSDDGLMSFLRNVPTLQKLELHQCLGKISHKIIDVMPFNLTNLSLERGVAWMTDADVKHLGARCTGLTKISFVGCGLLTPESLRTMAHKWQGMTNLYLKECGTMTSDGGCCLFACKALRQLSLRHNGLGLPRNFAECAHVELPFLQELCLDICDSIDKGFDSIDANKRKSLRLLRFTRCKTLRNCFNDFSRQHYKDTIIIEWWDNQERTTVVNEGL